MCRSIRPGLQAGRSSSDSAFAHRAGHTVARDVKGLIVLKRTALFFAVLLLVSCGGGGGSGGNVTPPTSGNPGTGGGTPTFEIDAGNAADALTVGLAVTEAGVQLSLAA